MAAKIIVRFVAMLALGQGQQNKSSLSSLGLESHEREENSSYVVRDW